jgi:malonyl-CoA/methylmalonyl-CoA synthetase
MTTLTGVLAFVSQAERFRERIAVVDSERSVTYEELLDMSARVATALRGDRDELHEERVGFLVTSGFHWVAVLWGIWRAGGVAVPLPSGSPRPELEYFVEDCGCKVVVFDEAAESLIVPMAEELGVRALAVAKVLGFDAGRLPQIDSSRRAMILYTSGTTSRPKGVVTTHDNINAQIAALVSAWEWVAEDRVLLCLPLHHVHGIINVVSCALWSGAVCEMLPRFDAETVLERIASSGLTLFMAVPTVYVKLIAAWEVAQEAYQSEASRGCARMRLMVSGSAALPVATLERWKEISGHTLLERYGMTEIGMALSNPLHGQRVPGSVGIPLPM